MEEFKKELLKVVENSQLPPEAIYFVVKDFYRDVIDSYEGYRQMMKEQAEKSAPQEDKEDKANENE
jgi:hypothetical protein